jgi:hypothetical protein
MTPFDPTRPPPGRLVRLGVVIDPTQDAHWNVARFCDLAGIDIVWVGSTDGSAAPDGGATASALSGSLARARLGVFLAAEPLPADTVASEYSIEASPRARDHATAVRAAAGGAQCRMSVVLGAIEDAQALLDVVDDVVLPAWRFPDLETTADEIRAEAAESGRDPATLGVAALLPVSVGRTGAEAAARVDLDPDFGRLGHPRDIGIFGTLEECQDRVIALAHAGISDLRCVLPVAPDIHDVIAQLTAVAIGTTQVLIPGSLRSPAPPPPDGWGGRPDTPPSRQVSGGSRRP